eukprot:Colp12_sorted_trinity150504_noHs@5497
MDSTLLTTAQSLETKSGRDKAFRLICYAARLAAALIARKRGDKNELSTKLNVVSSTISNFRTVLRLLDDVPMFAYFVSYGLGKHEKNQVIRWLNVVKNCFDQGYYPLEHVALAADLQIIKMDSTKLWYASDMCWTVSLLIGITTTLHRMKEVAGLLRKKPETADDREKRKGYKKELLMLRVAVVQNLADLACAIHWLPPQAGLWAGKLSPGAVGFFGVVSSLCGIYRTWPASS